MDDTMFLRMRKISTALLLAALLVVASLTPNVALASDPITYTLSDVRVLYLFDNPETIDWPTIYYLNDNHSCRIDLLTVKTSGAFRIVATRVKGREIYLHNAYVTASGSLSADSVFSALFASRRPDIVIFGDIVDSAQYGPYEAYLRQMPADSNRIFNILKIYQQAAPDEPVAQAGTVVLNDQEMFERYRDRMELEVPRLFNWFSVEDYQPQRLARYGLIQSVGNVETSQPDFLSGIAGLRLTPTIDRHVMDGQVKDALLSRSRNFVSFFTLAENTSGKRRVDNLVTGYKELVALELQLKTQASLTALADFHPYMQSLWNRAQDAVLGEIGVHWTGKIILRDSPHGPKLKFLASLDVNGPQAVELSYIEFHPYWDSTLVTIDSVSRRVEPHQSFVREYPVAIDRSRLESKLPDSLHFSAELVYSQIQLPVMSSIPVRETPNLSITFQPDFHFVPPVAAINVDKVVSSMTWKAIIRKPISWAGEVTVNLVTPRGVYAGAYKSDWMLESGRTNEMISIPFSVSKLFELGTQPVTITLSVKGDEVASDTAHIRIAACAVADTIKVGFLPDSTGVLEDILRMTNAGFQPLTDRSLVTADLNAFNVIIIGSGAFRDYPSLANAKGRLEDYLRGGGSLVIFGQPSDWPEGALPVSFVPARERVTAADVSNRISNARILSAPYKIDEPELLAYLDRHPEAAPAVISPTERVLVTRSGATLLSVSRLGDGQIIYCGLPVVAMISGLNLEAIHLFANILNY